MKNLMKMIAAAVLFIAGSAMAKADVITDPAQLVVGKVYTINTVRGYLTLNQEQTFLTSSHVNDGTGQFTEENVDAATDDESREFGFVVEDGRYYLYSPKLKMFALKHDQRMEFYAHAGTDFTFTTDGQAGAPLRMKVAKWGESSLGSDYAHYVNNNGNIVLNNYKTVDPGNSLMIEEVEGKTFDVNEAWAVFDSTDDVFNPHKVYYISTSDERMGQWGVATDGMSIVGTNDKANSNPGCSEVDRQWAFYRDGRKTYLYNVGMQMFVSKTGLLTSSKDEFADIGYILNNSEAYPYTLYMKDNANWFNGQGTGAMVVNGWKTNFDDGNRQMIEEVPGEDAYEDMQAFFETPSWDITYRLMFDGQEVATVVRNMTKGFEAKLPDDMIFSSCEYEYEPQFIENSNDIRVNVTWIGPFEFSDSYNNAIWYNLLFDRENEGRVGRWYAYWEEGTEPYYPKQDADEATRAAEQCQWAFVGNPYKLVIYNKAGGEGVTLANKGFDNGGNTAGATVLRPGEHYWIAKDYDPELDEFSIGVDVNGTFCRINQVGGASATSYFGLWTGFDVGSMLMVEDVPEVDVTDVFYDVYYNDALVASAKVIGQEVGAPIAEAPAELSLDYVELSYDESLDVSVDLHVRVDATWDGPFDLAPDYGSIHWYDMSVRDNWYVTSDQTNDAGALQTVNANPIGLGEDAYQWGFVGDPWHVKLYNKAKGSGVVFAWTEDVEGNIPTFVDASTENIWRIRKNNATGDAYVDAFMISVPEIKDGRVGQVNQYGGAGGVLTVWYGVSTADIGSAFKVFDVPDDYAQFVADDIAPAMEVNTKWFNWTDAARAAIGYKPEYKQACSLDQYKALRNAIEALKDDPSSYVFPETGYYRLYSEYHDDFICMATDPVKGDKAHMYDNQASTILKLTKVGDTEYTIQIQNEYFQPLTRSTTMVSDPLTPVVFKAFVAKPGYAAFNGTPEPDPDDADAVAAYNYGFIHRRNDAVGNDDLVGWDFTSVASHWQVFDAQSVTVKTGANGFTTFYAPFPVQAPDGVSALIGKIESDHLALTGVQGVVPALTPVVIKAEQGTYELPIVKSDAEAIEGNDLKGVLIEEKPAYAMTLAEVDGEMMFYTFQGEAIEPNSAYLRLADFSITEFPFTIGDLTGINTVNNVAAGHEVFDLSGRRVNKANKGVYIIDGKKMIVK